MTVEGCWSGYWTVVVGLWLLDCGYWTEGMSTDGHVYYGVAPNDCDASS